MNDVQNTINANLSELINQLNKLIPLAKTEEEGSQLRALRTVYYKKWEKVIETEIDSNTKEFAVALKELQTAREKAIEAKEDISRIAKAIKYAVKAANAIDKVLVVATKVML